MHIHKHTPKSAGFSSLSPLKWPFHWKVSGGFWWYPHFQTQIISVLKPPGPNGSQSLDRHSRHLMNSRLPCFGMSASWLRHVPQIFQIEKWGSYWHLQTLENTNPKGTTDQFSSAWVELEHPSGKSPKWGRHVSKHKQMAKHSIPTVFSWLCNYIYMYIHTIMRELT